MALIVIIGANSQERRDSHEAIFHSRQEAEHEVNSAAEERPVRPENELTQKTSTAHYAVFLVVHALVFGLGFAIAFLP